MSLGSRTISMGEFKDGDFIFAKMKGYPPWPARVESLAWRSQKEAKFNVYFYGTAEKAVVRSCNLCPYFENKERFGKSYKRKGFQEALDQIEEDVSWKATSDATTAPVDAKSTCKMETRMEKVLRVSLEPLEGLISSSQMADLCVGTPIRTLTEGENSWNCDYSKSANEIQKLPIKCRTKTPTPDEQGERNDPTPTSENSSSTQEASHDNSKENTPLPRRRGRPPKSSMKNTSTEKQSLHAALKASENLEIDDEDVYSRRRRTRSCDRRSKSQPRVQFSNPLEKPGYLSEWYEDSDEESDNGMFRHKPTYKYVRMRRKLQLSPPPECRTSRSWQRKNMDSECGERNTHSDNYTRSRSPRTAHSRQVVEEVNCSGTSPSAESDAEMRKRRRGRGRETTKKCSASAPQRYCNLPANESGTSIKKTDIVSSKDHKRKVYNCNDNHLLPEQTLEEQDCQVPSDKPNGIIKDLKGGRRRTKSTCSLAKDKVNISSEAEALYKMTKKKKREFEEENEKGDPLAGTKQQSGTKKPRGRPLKRQTLSASFESTQGVLCTQCSKTFLNQSALEDHCVTSSCFLKPTEGDEHSSTEIESAIGKVNNDFSSEPQELCELCGVYFPDGNGFVQHNCRKQQNTQVTSANVDKNMALKVGGRNTEPISATRETLLSVFGVPRTPSCYTSGLPSSHIVQDNQFHHLHEGRNSAFIPYAPNAFHSHVEPRAFSDGGEHVYGGFGGRHEVNRSMGVSNFGINFSGDVNRRGWSLSLPREERFYGSKIHSPRRRHSRDDSSSPQILMEYLPSPRHYSHDSDRSRRRVIECNCCCEDEKPILKHDQEVVAYRAWLCYGCDKLFRCEKNFQNHYCKTSNIRSSAEAHPSSREPSELIDMKDEEAAGVAGCSGVACKGVNNGIINAPSILSRTRVQSVHLPGRVAHSKLDSTQNVSVIEQQGHTHEINSERCERTRVSSHQSIKNKWFDAVEEANHTGHNSRISQNEECQYEIASGDEGVQMVSKDIEPPIVPVSRSTYKPEEAKVKRKGESIEEECSSSKVIKGRGEHLANRNNITLLGLEAGSGRNVNLNENKGNYPSLIGRVNPRNNTEEGGIEQDQVGGRGGSKMFIAGSQNELFKSIQRSKNQRSVKRMLLPTSVGKCNPDVAQVQNIPVDKDSGSVPWKGNESNDLNASQSVSARKHASEQQPKSEQITGRVEKVLLNMEDNGRMRSHSGDGKKISEKSKWLNSMVGRGRHRVVVRKIVEPQLSNVETKRAKVRQVPVGSRGSSFVSNHLSGAGKNIGNIEILEPMGTVRTDRHGVDTVTGIGEIERNKSQGAQEKMLLFNENASMVSADGKNVGGELPTSQERIIMKGSPAQSTADKNNACGEKLTSATKSIANCRVKEDSCQKNVASSVGKEVSVEKDNTANSGGSHASPEKLNTSPPTPDAPPTIGKHARSEKSIGGGGRQKSMEGAGAQDSSGMAEDQASSHVSMNAEQRLPLLPSKGTTKGTSKVSIKAPSKGTTKLPSEVPNKELSKTPDKAPVYKFAGGIDQLRALTAGGKKVKLIHLSSRQVQELQAGVLGQHAAAPKRPVEDGGSSGGVAGPGTSADEGGADAKGESPGDGWCGICRQDLGDAAALRGHLGTHLRVTRVCSACGLSFARALALACHECSSGGRLRCPACRDFPAGGDELAFEAHAYQCLHSRWVLSKDCALCNRANFATGRAFNSHVAHAHIAADKYECGVCSTLLTGLPAARSHLKHHHWGKDFHCKNCTQCFATHSQLQRHVSRQHGEAHACGLCGLRFSTAAQATAHQALHVHVNQIQQQGEESVTAQTRGFQCTQCGHWAPTEVAIGEHVHQLHEAAATYGCDHCEEVYDSPDLLRLHRATSHTARRTWYCNVCRDFFQPQHAGEHYKRHATESAQNQQQQQQQQQ